MAHQGQQIVNSRTGQRMTFIELTPELLRIDSLNPPTDAVEPVHVHPKQESGAEILSGSLIYEVETLFALAGRGLLDERGVPKTLQLAVMVPEFSEEVRVTDPPWFVVRTLAAVLGPMARRRGYQGRLSADAPPAP